MKGETGYLLPYGRADALEAYNGIFGDSLFFPVKYQGLYSGLTALSAPDVINAKNYIFLLVLAILLQNYTYSIISLSSNVKISDNWRDRDQAFTLDTADSGLNPCHHIRFLEHSWCVNPPTPKKKFPNDFMSSQ